jgi:hypothetical protein
LYWLHHQKFAVALVFRIEVRANQNLDSASRASVLVTGVNMAAAEIRADTILSAGHFKAAFGADDHFTKTC